jgi:hypothetical protein
MLRVDARLAAAHFRCFPAPFEFGKNLVHASCPRFAS